jgi:hypothetical protein
MLSNPAF